MWQRYLTAILAWLASLWKVDDRLSNDAIIEVYMANESEISALWIDMADRGIDASMRDAVEEWLRRKGK